MKLFIVATLFTIAAAGRLEHLERSYLPPDQGSNQAFGRSTFGSHGSIGSSGSHGLGGHGINSFDSNGIETQSAGARSGAFPGATINQYLPPDHGPSGSNGFAGSLQGFGNQRSQAFGSASQYSPSSQYGAPTQGRYQSGSQFGHGASQGHSQFGQGSSAYGQGSSAYGQGSRAYGQGSSAYGQGSNQYSQGSSQFPSTSNQYLTPKASSNYPQQAFDEQTGYHY